MVWTTRHDDDFARRRKLANTNVGFAAALGRMDTSHAAVSVLGHRELAWAERRR